VSTKIAEQRVERGGKETGMFRFQDEIIVLLRLQEFDDFSAANLIIKAMPDEAL
jgi:hypothetical protein